MLKNPSPYPSEYVDNFSALTNQNRLFQITVLYLFSFLQ